MVVAGSGGKDMGEGKVFNGWCSALQSYQRKKKRGYIHIGFDSTIL